MLIARELNKVTDHVLINNDKKRERERRTRANRRRARATRRSENCSL